MKRSGQQIYCFLVVVYKYATIGEAVPKAIFDGKKAGKMKLIKSLINIKKENDEI